MKTSHTITAVILAFTLLVPTSAWAHAYLVKAVPAQRAVLYAPPTRAQLWFNERLEPKFCTVTVLDAAGNAVDLGDGRVPEDDPKQLTVGLQALAPGIYTVKYRVLSVDGHVVEKNFAFTVRERR